MLPEPLKSLTQHAIVGQFMRFFVVGGLATAAHYAVLIGLVEGAGIAPLPATCAGYLVGAIISYALNRRFTFGARTALGRGFAKYLLVVGIGFLFNGAIVAGLIAHHAPYMAAQIAATLIVMFWNFVGSRYFVFRP